MMVMLEGGADVVGVACSWGGEAWNPGAKWDVGARYPEVWRGRGTWVGWLDRP